MLLFSGAKLQHIEQRMAMRYHQFCREWIFKGALFAFATLFHVLHCSLP
jgi:hypothetical protein